MLLWFWVLIWAVGVGLFVFGTAFAMGNYRFGGKEVGLIIVGLLVVIASVFVAKGYRAQQPPEGFRPTVAAPHAAIWYV